jgi:hypothetical protein
LLAGLCGLAGFGLFIWINVVDGWGAGPPWTRKSIDVKSSMAAVLTLTMLVCLTLLGAAAIID